MTIKKSIGWTNMTVNPIKGRCLGGCWYCFYSGERGIMNRFKHDPKIRIECNCLMNLPKTPKKIFLCSTHDLFGHWIPKGWKDTIFRWIEKYPQHTFQILTKFPQNIDRPMPDNCWIGVTVTGQGGNSERNRLDVFQDIEAKIKFISYEPILGEVSFEDKDKIDWLIMGALTGYSYKNRYRPHIVYLQILVHSYQRDRTKIFIKNNLKEIWGEPLIQEWPQC